MKLAEIFTQLTHGEFSQLSLGGAEEGEINAANWGKVLSHINLGLTNLYKRFPLKYETLTVQLTPGRLTYPLTKQYAASNASSLEPVKYILDSASPFKEDIHKVESVLTDAGYEFGLNDETDPYAIITPSLSTLKVPATVVAQSVDLPDDLKTDHLTVNYRANHPIILQGAGFDPDTQEVELPYSHLEALMYFVASRVHNPIGMVNEFHAGNSYAAKYELACQQLEQVNIRVDNMAQNNRLSRNGWV